MAAQGHIVPSTDRSAATWVDLASHARLQWTIPLDSEAETTKGVRYSGGKERDRTHFMMAQFRFTRQTVQRAGPVHYRHSGDWGTKGMSLRQAWAI